MSFTAVMFCILGTFPTIIFSLSISEVIGSLSVVGKPSFDPYVLPKAENDLFGLEYTDDKDGTLNVETSASEQDIKFLLYTTNSPDTPVELSIDDKTSLSSSGLIKDAPVKILTHGFHGTANSPFPEEMRATYLKYAKSDLNVIVLDWSELAKDDDYKIPVANIPFVAQTGARLITNLVKYNLTDLSKFHLIGHSLGAHVSGGMGMYVRKNDTGLGKLVPRVSGLDPAKPLFEFVPPDRRIDHTDGEFVDIIHTTGSTVGLFRTLGHADFYPNGGILQEGCGVDLWCSHSRAYMLFTESVTNPTGFKSCECPQLRSSPTSEIVPVIFNCHCKANSTEIFMGESLTTSSRGVYFVQTNGSPPFAQN